MRLVFLSLLATLGCAPLQANSGVGGILEKIAAYMDRSAYRGIDTAYIAVPNEPWLVKLCGHMNETTYLMEAHMSLDPEVPSDYGLDFRPEVTTGTGISAGVRIGYRGHGVELSKSLRSNSDTRLTLSTNASRYSLKFRLRRYQARNLKMELEGKFENENGPGEKHYSDWMDLKLDAPVRVKTVLLEGYYLFNGSHYSNAALYSQSTCQIRSAGSPMAGFTWFKSTIDYSDRKSYELINIMNNVGRTKQWQLAIGGGYAYNWVPGRQWLLNLQLMPMVSLLNKIQTWNYEVDFSDFEDWDGESDYYPTLSSPRLETHKSRLQLGGMVRAGILYSQGRLTLSVDGQASTFNYKHSDNTVRLIDWYLNASVGYRF